MISNVQSPPRRSLRAVSVCSWALLSGLASPAVAQTTQYYAPGSQMARSVEDRDQLEGALADARWSVGGVKVDPWIGIRQASYVDNVFSSSTNEESDLTVTAGAGLRVFVPLGSDVTAALYALPEYVWWRELEDRRRFNQRFGAGLFGYFSRMTIEIEGSRNEGLGIVTPESDQLINSRSDEGRFLLGARVYRSLELFAEALEKDTDHLLDDESDSRVLALDTLDRTERVLRAGARMRLGRRGRLAIGVEDQEVDFEGALDRSHEGSSPFAQLRIDGGRLFFDLAATLRQVDPAPGSEFVPLDELEAALLVSSALFDDRALLNFYGRRHTVYSFTPEAPYFLSTNFGVGLSWSVGRYLEMGIFAETGTHDYVALPGGAPDREDDTTATGASIEIDLPGSLRLGISADRWRVDSAVAEFDRESSQIRLNVQLGALAWP